MMINTFLCIVFAVMNPADPTGTTMYPSGIKVMDSHVFGAPPSTKLPLLAIANYLRDKNGRVVPPGHYKISVSGDRRYIMFFQNHSMMGVFNIKSSKELDEVVELNTAKAKNFNNDLMFIKLRQGKTEYQTIVPIVVY